MSALRQPYYDLSGEAMQGLLATKAALERGPLGKELIELLYLRVSQINGCAHCVNMHVTFLRKIGETEERLQNLVVWWEATCFTDQEKAALAWAEAVTLVADSRVPDDVFLQARGQFTDQELVDLTYVIITINAHNRLAVAFRRVPGS